MKEARRCLDSIDRARAASEFASEGEGHLSGCEACRTEVEAQRRLSALARGLPAPEVLADRVESVRTAVLAAVCSPPAPRRTWPWRAAAACLAAGGVFLAAGLWRSGKAGRPAGASAAAAASVQPHPGAKFAQAGSPHDQILRLSDGTVSVSVAPLRPGERFRVVVGDAEVEVHGTAFDVTAQADRLVEVRVLRGKVAVRPDCRTEVLLQPGERWTAPPPSPGPALVAVRAVPAPSPAPGPAPRAKAPLQRTLIARGEPPRPPPAPALVAVALEPRATGAARLIEGPPIGLAAMACPAAAPDAGSPPPAQPRGPTPAEVAFEQGFALLRSGAPAEAAFLFDCAVKASGGGALGEDASYWRAVALGRAARAQDAARAFRSFLDAFPASNRSGEAEAMLGRLLLSQGDAAGARLLFRAASEDAAPRVRKAALDGLELTRDVSFDAELSE